MPRRDRKPGIFGPYQHGNRYRIVVRNERGEGSAESYPTRQEAESRKRTLTKGLAALTGEKTVTDAIDAYELQHLKRTRENKPGSVTTTLHRLHLFFAPFADEPIGHLTPARCAARYVEISAYTFKAPRTGNPLAASTHRNVLAEAKTFARWCIGQHWIKVSPLAAIQGVGKRKRGKAQLRIDEARRWLLVALDWASSADDTRREGAVAAMLTLGIAERCGEIVNAVVRDVDDDGRLLWVPDAKTEAGKRVLELPAFLQADVKRLCRNKLPSAPLFGLGGHRDRAYPRKWVQRICVAAGVPKVTAHGMRGLHATLAVRRGSTAHTVAAQLDAGAPAAPAGQSVAAALDAARANLGHANDGVTRSAYIAPGTIEAAQCAATVALLLPAPRTETTGDSTDKAGAA